MGDDICQAWVGLICLGSWGQVGGSPVQSDGSLDNAGFHTSSVWVDVAEGLPSLTRFVLRTWGLSWELGEHFVRGHQDAPGCGHLSRLTSTAFWARCSVTDRVSCFPAR